MTDRINALYKRIKSVKTWCVKNATMLAQIAGFAAEETKLDNLKIRMTAAKKKQGSTTKGITETKKDYKKTMVEKTVMIAKKCKPIARNAGNKDMVAKLSSETTPILKLSDEECMIKCENVYDLINANLALFTTVTPQEMQATDTAIKDFGDNMMNTQIAIAEKKALGTEEMKNVIKESDDVLKNMGELIYSEYYITDRKFVRNFFSVIRIDDIGVRHGGIDFDVYIIDPVTKEVKDSAEKVTITVTDTTKTAKTDYRGFAKIREMKQDKYKIEFKRKDLKTKNVTVTVNRRKITMVNVGMEYL